MGNSSSAPKGRQQTSGCEEIKRGKAPDCASFSSALAPEVGLGLFLPCLGGCDGLGVARRKENTEGFPSGDLDTSTSFYSRFSRQKHNDFKERENQNETESKINPKCFYLMEMKHFDTVKTNRES